MASMLSWQCDTLLDAISSCAGVPSPPLPEAVLSDALYSLDVSYSNVEFLPHVPEMLTPAAQSCLLLDELHDVQVTDSNGASNCTTNENLDFLDCAPITSQDMSFVGLPSTDIELEGDEWSLLSLDSNSLWKLPSHANAALTHHCLSLRTELADGNLKDEVAFKPASATIVSPLCVSSNEATHNRLDGMLRSRKLPSNAQTIRFCPSSRKPKGMGRQCSAFKRRKSMNDVSTVASSDFSGVAVEDDDIHSHLSAHDGIRGCMSRNLESERKRRTKLNERLYSLRAIVPKISKMDKASIVDDAIHYVQELQNQVKAVQNDVLALQATQEAAAEGCSNFTMDRVMPARYAKNEAAQYKVLQMDVSVMEENTHHLQIRCSRAPGILVQLAKAIESLDSEIVSANLTTISEFVLNTVIIKVHRIDVKSPEDLKYVLARKFPVYGLHYASGCQ